MLIHSYGLFWRAEEINWYPGKGKRQAFRLLGRQGKNKGTVKLADFRMQRGIYILYDERGPYYVGLAEKLGKRLKDHMGDLHKNRWERFSWFGFRAVNITGKDKAGLQTLRAMPDIKVVNPKYLIKDVEALLIQAMSLKNVAQMKFTNATLWDHVQLDEVDTYIEKVNPKKKKKKR